MSGRRTRSRPFGVRTSQRFGSRSTSSVRHQGCDSGLVACGQQSCALLSVDIAARPRLAVGRVGLHIGHTVRRSTRRWSGGGRLVAASRLRGGHQIVSGLQYLGSSLMSLMSVHHKMRRALFYGMAIHLCRLRRVWRINGGICAIVVLVLWSLKCNMLPVRLWRFCNTHLILVVSCCKSIRGVYVHI